MQRVNPGLSVCLLVGSVTSGSDLTKAASAFSSSGTGRASAFKPERLLCGQSPPGRPGAGCSEREGSRVCHGGVTCLFAACLAGKSGAGPPSACTSSAAATSPRAGGGFKGSCRRRGREGLGAGSDASPAARAGLAPLGGGGRAAGQALPGPLRGERNRWPARPLPFPLAAAGCGRDRDPPGLRRQRRLPARTPRSRGGDGEGKGGQRQPGLESCGRTAPRNRRRGQGARAAGAGSGRARDRRQAGGRGTRAGGAPARAAAR